MMKRKFSLRDLFEVICQIAMSIMVVCFTVCALCLCYMLVYFVFFVGFNP